jgi:hypothetical protein
VQRIDESTYIDDTLVTCAEYQLFIDEMREQGRYYQPDHWTSYQFPNGQAREPILGVRQSDAITFCDWLTKHKGEGNEWNYRLPDRDEAAQYQTKAYGKSLSGNWLQKDLFSEVDPDDYQNQFARLYSAPEDARGIDFNFDFLRTIGIGFRFTNYPADIRRTNRIREPAISFVFDPSTPVNFDDIPNLVTNFDKKLAHLIVIACKRNAHVIPIPVLGLILESLHKLIKIKAQLYVNNPARGTEKAHALFQGFHQAIICYIDFFTLQERIAGRSPAFEGIRLVKERK